MLGVASIRADGASNAAIKGPHAFRADPVLTIGVGIAEPIAPGAIEVIDGDIIRAHGCTVRLAGFDAPESGLRARCESERALAAQGNLPIAAVGQRRRAGFAVGPMCMPTKHTGNADQARGGTPRCNYGRACGILTAAGKDVGDILISEGLARRYVCGRVSCPHRDSWCG